MRKVLIFGILFFIMSCKTSKDLDFVDDNINPQNMDLYFYTINKNIYLSNDSISHKNKSFHINGYYTNVKPSISNNNIPTNIFTKDNEYFNKKLNNKYIIYYADGKKIKMRIAYFGNNYKEKFETLNDVYNYLKKKKIPYKLIKEKKDINGIPYADILLTKNSLFCKIFATKRESVSNIYYNINDTLSTIQYGDNRNFYK
ncbi:hypothetical protein [Chryseobacterium sp. SIMBA_038]|uniref:hypothetical protein n=1 Tax=Chryseobacterium sp. SIMBA_038 TaxID=3085780 RepID=UPI00397A00B9